MSFLRSAVVALLAGCAALIQIAILPYGEFVFALSGVFLFLLPLPAALTFAIAGGFFLDLVGGSFGLRFTLFPLLVLGGRALISSVFTDRSLLSALVLSLIGYFVVTAVLLGASLVRAIVSGGMFGPALSAALGKEIVVGALVQLVVVAVAFGALSLLSKRTQ